MTRRQDRLQDPALAFAGQPLVRETGHVRSALCDPRGREPAAAARGQQPVRAGRGARRGVPRARAAAAGLERLAQLRRLARHGRRRSRLGEQANRHPPVLRSHDRFGQRIDEVEFHPAWHALMGRAIAEQVHALPWAEPRPGAHVTRAAAAFLLNQVESGVCCPIAMTFAAVPALRDAPALAADWLPKILSAEYDPARRAGRGQARRAHRHGDDREAGRLGPARHHHARRAGRRGRLSSWSATSGSARRRCRTLS